jgi:signal transduction histidine kinase
MAGRAPRPTLVAVLARAHTWLDRHPVAGDGALALVALAFAVSTLAGQDAEPSAAEWVLTVALVAPLAARRTAPVAAFAAVMLACGAQLLVTSTFLAADAAALIALSTLVAYAPAPLHVVGLGVALAGAVPFALHFGDLQGSGVAVAWLVLTVHLLLAAMLGDRGRVRVRERAGLQERARLLADERDRRVAAAAAQERARVLRELHDVVAHSLSVVIAQADGGRYAARADPGAAAEALTTIARSAREAQAEMRRSLGLLGQGPAAPLHPQPGVTELATLVQRTREAGLPIEFAERGPAPEPVAAATGMTIYRVAQEALTNVLKHAGPDAAARVELRWEPETVSLVVRDDGTGAGDPGDDLGRGMAGMRERVEPRGGTLHVGPRPGGGFEVRATLPLRAVS